MTPEERIARDSERIAVGTSIVRVREQDAVRASNNGVAPSAWSIGARKLRLMKERVWAKIA